MSSSIQIQGTQIASISQALDAAAAAGSGRFKQAGDLHEAQYARVVRKQHEQQQQAQQPQPYRTSSSSAPSSAASTPSHKKSPSLLNKSSPNTNSSFTQIKCLSARNLPSSAGSSRTSLMEPQVAVPNQYTQFDSSPSHSNRLNPINQFQQLHPKQHSHQHQSQPKSPSAGSEKRPINESSSSSAANSKVFSQLQEASGQQRSLLVLLKLYFAFVVILSLVYCAYEFALKSRNSAHSDQVQLASSPSAARSSSLVIDLASKSMSHSDSIQAQLEASSLRQTQLEQRLQLMQKYVELMALDLQDTKERLREREKCHCSKSCNSNGTQHADGSSWPGNQCDTCTCQSGKVICSPVKCPKPKCDDPQLLPGQCCPVCLKGCKYNQMSLRHGQTFIPMERPAGKECKCHDGLIRCNQSQLARADTQPEVRQKSTGELELPNQARLAQLAIEQSPNSRNSSPNRKPKSQSSNSQQQQQQQIVASSSNGISGPKSTTLQESQSPDRKLDQRHSSVET